MSPSVPQNVTTGAQNMCDETSGPRGSSSHSGRFQISLKLQYVIGSLEFCR